MKPYLLLLLAFTLPTNCFSQDKLMPLDKDLTQVNYPHEVKFLSFESQGQQLKMAYMNVVPAKANGKTILLLHGKNFNAAYWEETIAALTKKGFRVIAPDQIGFGKSTKPEHYQYSFNQLAENTKAILDDLKINKVMVLGHSMGGMVASRFALSYPELTEKLILENPIGLEDYKLFSPYQTVDANYKEELKKNFESYKSYQLKFYYDNKWLPKYDRWLNLLAGWTLHKDYPIIAWNAALTSDMVFTQPVVYEFKNIKCPTLLIIGTRDRTAIGKEKAPKDVQPLMGLYNELGKKTQQAIPNSTLMELDNIGHLPHVEDFDRFIQPLLVFLER
ncbi:pimeloyl-ACP methyl ester carboxylesterase [Flavobacterium arsenatis]|uniref:Pimeloyl-ACP methyl ester carboxylesterase n=1 Tax=Flavobacterium arsenatis TaxID=1484332 RepID=A0ABU1TNT7_9FLAO|nr:alpha/beta hydrolase [Flavobacterium arsenatis]MDR6967629.1 pimeloyl-ACP methyl ester carboxylesterase [Flavobacterium arsenatis]